MRMLQKIAVMGAALVLAVTGSVSGFFGTLTASADAPELQGSFYFSDVLAQSASNTYGVTYTEDYATWTAFLDAEAQTDDYLGARYIASLYAASPKCDPWQGYVGTNCTGFVWHILSNGMTQALQKNTGVYASIQTVGEWFPNVNGFNWQGYSRKCWNNGGWWSFISANSVHYYQFQTKAEMLSSGVLHKGDIIWCVDGATGTLSIGSNNHHIGIYMGDGTSDLWWHSGVSSYEYNAIENIRSGAYSYTFLVVPWADANVMQNTPPVVELPEETEPEIEPVYGDVNGDFVIDIQDAGLTLHIYATISAQLDTTFYTEYQLAAADYNQDGTVNLIDSEQILSDYAKNAARVSSTAAETEYNTTWW